MDDQIDEKEVFEDGGWNQDYDIAEDEEERLLIEEDELLEPTSHHDKEAVDYELYETEETNEGEENAEADETVEAEEDILDLDANEDVVEFEETQVNVAEEMPKGSESNSVEAKIDTTAQTLTGDINKKNVIQERRDGAQQKFVPYSRNQQMRRNQMQNRANHPMPVQMGYPGGRQRPMFAKQIRPMDSHMHPMVRRPLMPDPHFPPPPLNAPRHMHRIEPLMPNFPPRMPPNQLRFDQGPFSFNQLMHNELNQGANRFFVNHPFQPRRDLRDHPGGPAPPFTEIRSPFSPADIMPKIFHGPPPLRPHEMVNIAHPRFSTNLPPPPLPAHAAANSLAQGPNLRMKLQAPQSLMDIVLPPFGEAQIQPPMFQDRQQRFRFGSPDQRGHRSDFAPPPGPPPLGCKRPPVNEPPVIPVKQLRNEPRLPLQRTVNNHAEALEGGNRPAGNGVKNLIRPSQLLSPNSRRSLLETPKTTAALLPTPSSAATTVASTSSAATATSTTPLTIMKIDTQGDGSSQEMDEYMKKMEEQRKKREEVLRMKEERRRLKLAGLSDAAETRSHNQNSSPGKTSNSAREQSGTVAGIQTPLDSLKVKESTSSLHEPKKCITTPPSGQTGPQQNTEPNRRFKVIIVKSKSGKILEKRRVPVGDGGNADLKEVCAQVTSAWSNGRMSETVEIENLNISATEEDIRKLCQMFGPVQEVYPKLQEGKAIVRFVSSKGANNFFCNHNIPGIAVRYL